MLCLILISVYHLTVSDFVVIMPPIVRFCLVIDSDVVPVV